MAHPNEELMHKGYEAFKTGDMDTLRNLFDTNIVWHTGGRNQLTGDYKGIDEVLSSFMKIFELTGGNFSIDLHDVLANDEHAIALGTSKGKRDGKMLESNFVHVAHVKNGKMTESWLHPDDQYAVDEFWS